MHNLYRTTQYLTEFFASHYNEYFEMTKNAKPSSLQESFDGEDIIIQGMRNIIHNISDNYANLNIPQGFASPELLVNSLKQFQLMAENQYKQTLDINKKLGEPWFSVIVDHAKMSFEVAQAIDYGLSLSLEEGININDPLTRLRNLMRKLPKVAHELIHRRKENGEPRPTLVINDEYDVQDLMRALLYIEFDDVRPEECCPTYAGSSNRVDFLLKNEQIIIEVKKTRNNHNARRIGEELTIDIASYRKHDDCSHLVCFVWDDSKKISNPNGLITDLENSNPGFVTVHIHQ